MALRTFPDVPPSPGSGPSTDVRVLRVRLGDGYEQVSRDGLNSVRRSYRATWEGITVADAERVRSFLAEHAGVTPFNFTVPGEAAATQWRCERWSGPAWRSATRRDMSAEFVEDFSP